MKIGELFVQLGINADTSKAEHFASALNNTTIKAVALVAGLVGVSLELRHLLQQAMETSMGLAMFESQTGLSGEQLQKWQIMAERSGASAESATSSVESLQRAMTEIRLGGGNVKPFQMLGIDVNQSPFKALEQIRERIQGMDRGMATNLVSSLGINPEMIRLLTMTNSQFKAMAGDDMIISEKNRRRFVETRLELTKLRQEFNYFAMNAIGSFLPFATAMTKAILDWKAGLIALGLTLTVVLAQMYPLTAAIAGLLLLMQDFYTYKQGGDSVFGDIFGADGKPGAYDKMIDKLPNTGAGIDQGINAIIEFFKNPPKWVGAETKVQTNNVNIAVHGSASAKETAKEVKTLFDRHVDHAAAQRNNGGH